MKQSGLQVVFSAILVTASGFEPPQSLGIEGLETNAVDFVFRLTTTLNTVLTAADVRCAVVNTSKMAKWMMCCLVSEGVTAVVRCN